MPEQITLRQWNNHGSCDISTCRICSLLISDFSWEELQVEFECLRSDLREAQMEIKRQILRSDKKTKKILKLRNAFQRIKKGAETYLSTNKLISPPILIKLIDRVLWKIPEK